MRSQTGIGFLVVSLVQLSLFGCGVAPPVECSPGGRFPQSQERKAPRASSAAPLTITGTVAGPDGRALAGQALVLDKLPNTQDLAALFFLAPFVLADCLTFRTNALCDRTRTAHSDARAAYRFEVDDEPVDGRHSFELYTQLPATGTQWLGPWVSRSVYPQGQHLSVDELRLWDPVLDLRRSKGRLAVTVADGRCSGSEAVELVSETGEPWYQVYSGHADDALFDDAPIGVRLVATVGSTRYVSGVEPLTDARIPPSRGAPCTVRRVDGTTAIESPCSLTDGSGALALGADVASVELTLPAPLTGAIAVRGYGNLALKVETSGDGTTWQTAVERLYGSEVVRGRGLTTPPARLVRLTPAEDARQMGRVFEVLVW